MSNLISTYKDIKTKWFFKEGLFLWTFFIFGLYESAYSIVRPSLNEIIDVQQHHLISTLHILGFALTFFLILTLWIYSRRIPRFPDNEIVILFSPHGSEEVSKVINDLWERLKFQIGQEVSIKRIRLEKLPPNHVIRDIGHAL